MANNRIQVKRTSVAGRTANTTDSGNSQYIAAGEFALNMPDGILYTSNGSVLITVGSNVVNQNITGNLTVKAIIANNSIGSAGQTLTSNGSAVYWSAGAGSGTVTQVGSGNGLTGGPITTSGTLSVLANTGIVANTTGLFVNATYIGTLSANNTTFVNGKTEGNLNVNNATTAYSKAESALNVNSALTANNSTNLGGVAAASYQTTAGLSANVATLTANNTSFVGAVSAANVVSNAQLSGNLANYVTTTNLTNNLANYQTTAGLSANVATLTANNANFVKANNGITSNSLGVFVTQGTGTVVNATGVHVNATYIGTLTANNATNLNGQAASFYTNATNITTGTLPYAQIPANIVNTTGSFTLSGITTFGANVVLGSSGLSANGGFGTAGHVLHSNGTATYWAADDNAGGTVTSVASGNGLTGGPITTTGTLSVLANNGIVSNSTGVFVNAQSPLVANATGLHIATSAGSGTFSSGISAITVDSVGRVTSVTGSAGYVTSSGVTSVATGNGMTGGTITATGTVSILANTGVVANATGLFVNATYIGTLSANNTTYVNGKTEGNLNVNNALTSNNSSYLGGVQASQFMRTDAVSTHTTGKFTVYTPSGVVGTVSGTNNLEIFQPNAGSDAFLTFHISGDYAANFGIDGTTNDLFYGGWSAGANKYRVWHAGNDGTTSGLDADLLDGQHGSFYTNATNITTGTLPYAQIPANVINTTAAFTRTGVTTFSANVILGSSGLSANGGFGTAGQVLHSNGTATYWAADDNAGGTVTSVATGNGMTGGTITTTGTVSILANTGVVANTTGLFVNATYIGTLTANNTSFLGGVAAASYVQNTDSRTLSGNINFTGVNNFFTGATLGGTAGNIGNNITLFNSVGGNAGNFRFYTERNATGADWTTASARLQYRIDVTDMGYMEFNPPNASGVTSGQGLAFGGTDGTEAMRITAAGSVGIGNTTPQEKLHVAGAIVTSGATAANKTAGASFDYSSGFGGGRILSWGPIGTNSTLSFWSGSGGGGAVERFRFDTVGNFGIGNATPSHKLRVEGDISLLSGVHANGSFGTAGQVLTTNGTVAYWAAAAGGGYYKGGSAAVGTLAAGGQNIFRVNANTLNYNTTIAAGENAQATGPIAVAAGITLTVASGARVSIV